MLVQFYVINALKGLFYPFKGAVDVKLSIFMLNIILLLYVLLTDEKCVRVFDEVI